MIYRFADLDLDLGRRVLSRGTDVIPLPRLSFRVLKSLLDAAPNLVKQDDLIDQAWGPNRIVSPENLSQRILMLRKSLGDDAHSPVYIEAARGQGYRIIPAVERVEAQTEPPRRSSNKLVNLLLVAALAVIALFLINREGYQREVGDAGAAKLSSIAVLPFDSLSPDTESNVYAAGIHEELLNQLTQLGGLDVISRTSMMGYAGTRRSIPEIARELNVGTVVEGSVQYAEGRVRVTVQLVDGARDTHLWSRTYDREADDIFEIESDIARNVAQALRITLSDETNARLAKPPTTSLEAYGEYVLGRQALAARTPHSLSEALEHFRRACELDPGYVLAWVGQADAMALLSDYTGMGSGALVDQRVRAIERALELDPESGNALLAMAFLKQGEGSYPAAEAYYRRSMELIPGEAQAYHWYSHFLSYHVNRPQEGLAMLRKALVLNPLGKELQSMHGHLLFLAGQLDESLDILTRATQRNPEFPMTYGLLSFEFQATGKLAAALHWARRGVQLPSTDSLTRSMECASLVALAEASSANACYASLQADVPMAKNDPLWLAFENQTIPEVSKIVAGLGTDSHPMDWPSYAFVYFKAEQYEKVIELLRAFLPEWFGAGDISVHPAVVLAAVWAGISLIETSEPGRGSYLMDQALRTMDSMDRNIGYGYGIGDVFVYACRGEKEEAIHALKATFDSGWRKDWWQLRHPIFDSLREEPQFNAIIADLETDIANQTTLYELHQNDPVWAESWSLE